MGETSGDRRAEILAAATQVLAREGLAQATTRRIAAEAGINQATLLYYMGSKDDLLLAALREMMAQTRAIVQGSLAVSATGSDPFSALRQALAAFWAHVESAPELQVMQYELTLYALRHPASAWLAREQYAGYVAVVEALLREAFTAASMTCGLPFDALARFLVGGMDGLILQFISDRDAGRARRDLETLTAAAIALAQGAGREPAAR